jgi:hypothetical protein
MFWIKSNHRSFSGFPGICSALEDHAIEIANMSHIELFWLYEDFALEEGRTKLSECE